jgi:hypothetical protein
MNILFILWELKILEKMLFFYQNNKKIQSKMTENKNLSNDTEN